MRETEFVAASEETKVIITLRWTHLFENHLQFLL